MRIWICILAVIAWAAGAKGQGLRFNSFTTNAISTYIFTPSMTAAQITNAVGSLAGNTLKHFTAGNYIIPTNTTSWVKPGVTNLFHFDLGATVFFGHESDNVAARSYFNDAAGAATLRISGQGTLIQSNTSSGGTGCLIVITNPSSDFVVNLNSIQRYSGVIALVHQRAGRFYLNVDGLVRNDGYDFYWGAPYGNSLIADIRAKRVEVGDTALELLLGAAGSTVRSVYAHFGHLEGTSSSGGVLLESEHSATVDFGTMQTGIQGIKVTCVGSNVFTVRGGTIYGNNSDFSDILPLVEASGNLRLVNTAIFARTNGSPIGVLSNGLELINVTIAPWDFAYAIDDMASGITNTVKCSGLTFSQPISPLIKLQGSWNTTNSLDTVLTADNQVVSMAGAKYVKLSSDNGTAGNRTFVLVTSTMSKSDAVTLEWVGTNAGELVDDAAMSGGGNARLNGTWTPTQYDTITLEHNGTDLVERSRSAN